MAVSIIKEDLKNLYQTRNLTINQIANIYSCGRSTILKRLHKFNIKIRIYRVNLSESKLKYLYLKNKLSTWKIESQYGYCRGTVYRKLSEYGIKKRNIAQSHATYIRRSFSDNLLEKAYLIGFSMGDLRVRKRGPLSETISVGCGSTKKEQINLINKLFRPYGRVWISKPGKMGVVNIECLLDRSFAFLLEKRILADNWISKNKKYFLSFIAGFSDAEGCLSFYNDKGYYSLGNYNKGLLNQIRDFLLEREIICTKLTESKIKGRICFGKYYHNQNYWHFRIHRKKSLLNLFNLVGVYLKHELKIKDMNKVIKNIEERNNKFGYLKMG